MAPSLARERLDHWLQAHSWPAADRADLVLAVSEAISNSVEHGYSVAPGATSPSGAIEVSARIDHCTADSRTTRITVRDHGRWLPATTERTSRGHGLIVMRACVRDLDIVHAPAGTTVRLTGRPVPVSGQR